MSEIISFINLKGGVGKTTSAIALSECLRASHGKRVLLVDLDPQTNSTIALISQEHWRQRNELGQTVAQIFKDAIEGTQIFDINEAVLKDVSTLNVKDEGGCLDLLPSSIQLNAFQDSLFLISQRTHFAQSPIHMLLFAISDIAKNYDYIIVDCPPNLGNITMNGILLSDYYIIPTVPDSISTYGIPQIMAEIEKFKRCHEICRIRPMGILPTLVRKHLSLHDKMIKELQGKALYPPVFGSKVPNTIDAARSTDLDEKNPFKTFAQKYPGGLGKAYSLFTEEVIHYCES